MNYKTKLGSLINWKTYFTTEKDSVMDDVFFIYSVITAEGRHNLNSIAFLFPKVKRPAHFGQALDIFNRRTTLKMSK